MTLALAGLFGGLAFNTYWHYGKVESRFQSEVDFMRQHVRELMTQNESVLSGFSAFLTGSRVADMDATETYAQRMIERYPHILMFEVAQRVDQYSIKAFQRYLQAQGKLNSSIWAFDYERGIIEHNLSLDGEAFPVIFVEPNTENAQLGLDINSIEFIHQIVSQLDKTDQILMTEPFELIDEEEAIVMIQGVNLSENDKYGYISILVIQADQLKPSLIKNRNWNISLTSRDSNGRETSLFRNNSEAAFNEGKNEWTTLFSKEKIQLNDFEFTLEVHQQLTLDDFDWFYILGAGLLTIIFPLFVIIMYRVHQDIESQNSKKRHELYQLANFDVLTGLANRFHFDDFGQRILSTAKRNSTQVAVYFIDLNGFKQINDNLGHDVGDLVLKKVADTLMNSVRQGDIVARIGGDEFAILADQMPSLHSLMSMLNNVREAILSIQIEEIKQYKVSGSVGFSYTEYHGYDLSELLKMADNSMYGEKQEHYSDTKDLQVDEA